MATIHSAATSARTRRGDAVILHAQSILNERLREPGAALASPDSVRDLLRLKLAGKPHEVFIALWLDAQNRLIFPEELFRGTLTQTAIYPREVVKSALHHNAAAVIFAHNHPGGCLEPSKADLDTAASLTDALRVVEVKVLDHFIVGGSDVLSFAERGLLADGKAEPISSEASAMAVQEQTAIEEHDFGFTAATTLYSVSGKATRGNAFDHLTARLSQLCAMLSMISGEGLSGFDQYNDKIRGDYLWSCAMMAQECEELVSLI
jgi:hypothetical protein